MNLGSFAGGLAQGYTAGEKLQLARKDQASEEDYRNRALKLREDEAGVAAKDRQRADKQRTEDEAAAEAFKNADPNDLPTQMKLITDAYARSIKKGMTPELAKSWMEYHNKHKADESAAAVMKWAAGDPAGLEAFAKLNGTTPDQVKLTRNEETKRYMVSLGGKAPVDVQDHILAVSGVKGAADVMNGASEREQKLETHKSNLGRTQAAIRASDSTVRRNDAAADNSRLAATEKRDTLKQRDVLNSIRTLTSKEPDAVKAEFIMGRAPVLASGAKGKVDINALHAQASREYQQVVDMADAKIAELKKAGRKPAEFGAGSWDKVRSSAIRQKLPETQTFSAPAKAKAPAEDTED